MVLAIAKEIAMRKNEFKNQTIETIYFGGGTPSLLNVSDLMFLINQVYSNYNVSQNTEITIEANPDDLSENRIIELSKTPINRLSIGIQSFFEEDLQLMNRAHNSAEAKKCLEIATQYFDNISVDLIYGTPGMSNERWLENIKIALDLNIPHISSYALTVEPKTALHKFIKDGMMPQLDDAMAHEQFLILVDTLETNKFIHYELSNFGKENYFSKNNSAYWLGKKYIGVGPSAHSYDGKNRSWNLSNNGRYLKSISENTLPSETETLSKTDKYNEYIMTGLRTIWGVSLNKIESEFGEKYLKYLLKNTQKYLDDTKLILENNILRTTRKGKFFCDGIASDLFYLDLE
ncbi:putative coproporphyrinogen oxidase [Flavobacterium psychrophilum]|nr:putative coproporphyrinogen oxidase [Flavobacterium psychrophilum]SNA87914.1 putative coproporphyrinogen oxidase [Flavobacterium psychrophilum]SNB04286.1 putative coproporphyrinogen oxidase [Flavobacterium psychrophilum]SNB29295.1 putative coproporphyrinogen oxidase [Flavobacterium psychrophilum]